MATSLFRNPFFDDLAAEHRTWLSRYNPQHLANWEKILNADEEAALAEAGIRRLLEGYGVRVDPFEDLTGAERRPDFCCSSGGRKFYVEVTSISTDSATTATGLPLQGSAEPIAFRPLNDAVFSKCLRKAAQCANLDAPALLAIVTFHDFAAMASFDKVFVNWLLTGEAKVAWTIDARTGNRAGDDHHVTEVHRAVFLELDQTQEVGFARNSISGLLLCDPAMRDLPVLGVLHPNPARPFDPAILPRVEFGRVAIDRVSRRLSVAWPQGADEARTKGGNTRQ